METIIVLSEAGIFTGIIYLINSWVGKKHPAWHVYVVGFFVICGILLSRSANAHDYYQNYGYYENQYSYDFDLLSDSEKKMCADNMLKCERIAKYHYNLAKDKCWWLPDLNDRSKARFCYTTAVAGVMAFTPQSKVVAMISGFLLEYGLNCLDEWNYINDNMMQSKAWWESYEFYKENLESNR